MSKLSLDNKSNFGWSQESDNVFYSKKVIFTLTDEMIDFLLKIAVASNSKQSRLCVHNDHNDALHEMIIVHYKGHYVAPHKHINKIESFHIIKGILAIVIFSNDGEVSNVIILDSNGGNLFYRLSDGLYHTVIPVSEYVIFHEVTNGPFHKNDVNIPEWASNKDSDFMLDFQKKIKEMDLK